GLGGMGSWFIKELSTDHTTVGYDADKKKMETAGTACLENPSELSSFSPDLLINAVTLQNTVQAFETSIPYLPPDCSIADIATIKRPLLAYYKNCGRRFISVHPMFGPRFSDLEHLQKETVIIIRESDGRLKDFFGRFFRKHGLTLVELSFEEHDRVMATALTVPFVCSMIFAAVLQGDTVPGTTFARHRVVAEKLLKEENSLLAEVLFNSHSLTQIKKLNDQLALLESLAKRKNRKEVRAFFDDLRKKF
ncbi:MAG: prephenate dehydrogenase/arogenate dehydrogenase family protein, partial [Euryarchaeota archaeon]|nr:prephenate dehydrogenase/arogenate dehydrogenase family protein [Euryarchaeota archaeon]